MAGGVGSSMIAANAAWEFSHPDKKSVPLKTLLIDLDLQFGSISTYLDVESKNAVLQMLSDTEALDEDSFSQAITKLSEHFSVLTAPPEIAPYDLLNDEDIDRILKLARRHFDLVIIDMPKSVTTWTDAVLRESDEYIAVLDLDMRSTNNVIRLLTLLEQEKQPFNKMRYVLNRAPKFTDLTGKSRIKRLSDALGIDFEFMLSDGGKPITTACDQGEPLATSAAKNPLRKDLLKMVKTLYDQLPQELKAA
jgi:pilus assembly protein CpaE